jgi:hypothetical protein
VLHPIHIAPFIKDGTETRGEVSQRGRITWVRDQKILVFCILYREGIQKIANVRADAEVREPAYVNRNPHKPIRIMP